MSQQQGRSGPTDPTGRAGRAPAAAPPSLWVGVVIFAAGALLVSGGFAVVQGLVALLKEDLLQLRERPVLVDLTAWGWVNLVFGAVQVGAAFALLVGARWARLVAVLVAGFSAVVQMLYLPTYPVSAIVVLGLDLVVIWAVVVHGRDIRRS